MKCYYCEKKDAVTTRFNKPSCRGCNMSYLIKEVEAKRDQLTEEEKAERYKMLMQSFPML